MYGPKGVYIENYKKLSAEVRREKETAANRVITHYYDILTYNEGGLYTKLRMLVNPKTGMLEDRLIIIDEVHDFISRMSNITNQSRRIYYFLMDHVSNCKFLGLSGSPILNSAYELAVLFNIFRGRMNNTLPLFPESADEFNDRFVNYLDSSVLNQQLFQRRISGLVSYYNIGSSDFSQMPEKIVMPTNEILMSDYQYKLYLSERYSESKKEQSRNKTVEVGSSFRTYSRMVCNFVFPEEISRPKPISARDFRSFERFKDREIKHADIVEDVKDDVDPTNLDTLDEPDPNESTFNSNKTTSNSEAPAESEADVNFNELTKKQRQMTYTKMLDSAYDYLVQNQKTIFSKAELLKYSPKMAKILENIANSPGNQGMKYIYTEFRILEGIRILSLALEHVLHYEKIDFSQIKSFADLKKLGKKKRYGVISSEEDRPQRKLLIQISKESENDHGEYLDVIMGTSASSQGINLQGITQVHIMEPYWNMVRNNQVIGRAVRINSHTHLPEDERKVYIYTYRMVLTREQQMDISSKLDSSKESSSTEEYVHRLAMQKEAINNKFSYLMKSGSVDCNLNYLVNIQSDPNLVCLDVPEAAGPYLYYPDINQDPTDYEYIKNIKYETFVPAKKMINDTLYGYKAHINGKPILTQITYRGRIYPNAICLYDYDMLVNNIEIVRKFYVLDLNKLIDKAEITSQLQ
mgnify:CR=1 FL=1